MTQLQEICNDIAFDEMEIGDQIEIIDPSLNISNVGDVVKINAKKINQSHNKAIYYNTDRFGGFETNCSVIGRFAQYYRILPKNETRS